MKKEDKSNGLYIISFLGIIVLLSIMISLFSIDNMLSQYKYQFMEKKIPVTYYCQGIESNEGWTTMQDVVLNKGLPTIYDGSVGQTMAVYDKDDMKKYNCSVHVFPNEEYK